MKKSHKDRLADALVDELFDKLGDPDDELTGEIEVDFEDRDRVRGCLNEVDRGDVESSIESAQALLDRLDLNDCDGEVTWDVEYRIQHARAVLANSFLALYGGFGERLAIDA